LRGVPILTMETGSTQGSSGEGPFTAQCAGFNHGDTGIQGNTEGINFLRASLCSLRFFGSMACRG